MAAPFGRMLSAPETIVKLLRHGGAFSVMSAPAARKAPMSATRSTRPQALALGLILPLALAGAATAQEQSGASRTGWVDPPPRAAAPVPAQGAVKAPAQAARNALPAPPKVGRRDAEPVRQAARPEPGEDARPKASGTRALAPKRAAAPERSPGREALRHHARHPHPLAETLAVARPVPAAVAERAAAAQALMATYLATVSGSGDTMVDAATQFYATRVRFYGRPVTTAGLVAEKRSFAERWPERRYELRAMRAVCDSEACTIRTRVDFRTANPGRGAISSGEAELILEVGFAGTRPYIVGETGRVLRRSIQAGTLAPSPGKA